MTNHHTGARQKVSMKKSNVDQANLMFGWVNKM